MPNWRYALLCCLIVSAGCGNKAGSTKADAAASASASTSTATGVATLKKLEIKDLKVGTGETAKIGDTVWVFYRGTLTDKTVFDAHMMPDNPISFTLTPGNLVEGWIKGIPGMKVGTHRLLSCPAALGYGAQPPSDKIPPNSDLYFDITLLFVSHPENPKAFDMTDKVVGAGPAAKIGSSVKCIYRGYLLNDKEVVTSMDTKNPDAFTIGKGEVIPGLEYGVVGMKKGGKRTLLVPPGIAFGIGGKGIPQNSPIRFEVEMLDVK